eukprot:TRINITY_DN10017_c0_g1_i3.p1 TRINITY_DN10017_c0_g1~~TRINITY_DN10017_c0_g1_i3.p1  ORF type:complete len:116 (+),score=21.50 TRINITY_DN10017_c0_g1_i3:76-423(+)
MIRRPPRSTLSSSSAASDVYKRQVSTQSTGSRPSRYRRACMGMLCSKQPKDAAGTANVCEVKGDATSMSPRSGTEGRASEHHWVCKGPKLCKQARGAELRRKMLAQMSINAVVRA